MPLQKTVLYLTHICKQQSMQWIGKVLLELACRTTRSNSCRYCQVATSTVPKKQSLNYGQPSSDTHPHLLQTGQITWGLSASDFHERRTKLMELIAQRSYNSSKNAKSHLVLIPSSTKVFMSENIPYPFRQNTDFLYLTGSKEPDSILILQSVDGKLLPEHKSVLFIPKANKHTELWEGPKMDIDYAISFFGVDSACYLDDLENYLSSIASKNSSLMFWYNYLTRPFPKVHETVRDFVSNYKNLNLESPHSLIHELRLIKSVPEMKLMEKSCRIVADSMVEVMKFSSPSVLESHLQARMDYECRLRGADYLAFPPVVAGGNRANVIHYIFNNQPVGDGEMVLMDAGCEFHGYTSDMTRTWPVSGQFSQPQKELYEMILSVQEELIELCNTFPSLDYLFKVMCEKMGQKLQELGIISRNLSKSAASEAAYSFCPHHVSHYLGMDVHDTGLISRGINIRPGMVVTVEPGIYLRSDDHRVPERYRGLCIRIEDDILITEQGPKILTASCPKHVDNIEKLLSSRNNNIKANQL